MPDWGSLDRPGCKTSKAKAATQTMLGMHDGGAIDQPGCRTSKAKAVAPRTAQILAEKVHELEGMNADVTAKIMSLEQTMTGIGSVTSPDQCCKHCEGIHNAHQSLAIAVDQFDQVRNDLVFSEQNVLHLQQHFRSGLHGLWIWHVFCCKLSL